MKLIGLYGETAWLTWRGIKSQGLELVSLTHVGAPERRNGVDFSPRLPCFQVHVQYPELNRIKTEMS